jgi:hypothetical protein
MDRLLFLRWTSPPAVRTVPSGFRPILTPDEARAAWERFRGLGAWDGPAVRLERLDGNGTLLLSPSSYRYWCLSHGLAGQEWREADAELAAAVRKIRATPPPRGWADLLSRRGWANTLGLMVFLRDSSGQIWGALRSKGVVDGAGDVAAAVCGGVEPVDLDSDDPLTAACVRECEEETGLRPWRLELVGMAAAAPKWQPSVVAVADASAPSLLGRDAWETARYVPILDGSELCGLSRLVWPHVQAVIQSA